MLINQNNNLIRKAGLKDADAINIIYTQAIKAGLCTADTDPYTREKRNAWLKAHINSRHPVFVYETDQKVVGWCSLSPYREGRRALDNTVEISYYIDFDYQGQNIASKLIDYAQNYAIQSGFHVIFAIIIEKNTASIHLLEKFGFNQWGYLPEVLWYNQKYFGQVYMGKILNSD